MEKGKFEDSLREAFQKAEVGPSENVWTNIELDLERLDSGKMKRRIFFYKLVAAASVAFAMAIGGAGYFIFTSNKSNDNILAISSGENKATSPLTDQSPERKDRVENSETRTAITDPDEKMSSVQKLDTDPDEKFDTDPRAFNPPGNSSESARSEMSGVSGDREQLSTANYRERVLSGAVKTESNQSVVASERKLPSLVRKRKYELHFPKTEPDPIDLMIAQEEWKEKKNRESRYEKVWTSVGFSAGSFSEASAGTGTAVLGIANTDFQTYSASNTLSNEANASGISYSVGINVGTRLSKRWVLQGGLNYMTQNSSYTSDALITTDFQNYSVANSAEITKLSDGTSEAKVVRSSPYDVNNNLQFLSVPIQAGYVLLNRDFAIQLNGGVSTDLFIQNTITPEDGSLEKVSTGRGEDSPYRPLNFSGLVGTEFSYRFADRYRLSLTPGLRYPFSSIYKSETGLQSNPVTFDVGLRFRYIFR